jgi:hypothetical protein
MLTYRVTSSRPQTDHKIEDLDNLNDELKRIHIAESIAAELRGSHRPGVLGVYGWWGSGKSYLLSQVINLLLNEQPSMKDPQVVVCVFSPWRYEIQGDLASGLINSLLHVEKQFIGRNPQFENQLYKTVGKELLDMTLEIGPSLVPGGQALAQFVSKAVRSTIAGINKAQEQSTSLWAEPQIDQFRNKMQELVNQILCAVVSKSEHKDYRLVVFIDDLDRCSPENMVRMFEWLKTHLIVNNCTYVLALDHIASARAITGQYKDYLGEDVSNSDRDTAYGFRYLEKLVDSEYELETSPNVESMAVRQACRDMKQQRISEVARNMIGADFLGMESMDSLLRLRCLRTPRTMLKIAYKFKIALEVVINNEGLKSAMPEAFPFWALFMTAMYYQLEPDELSRFKRGQGILHELMNNRDPQKTTLSQWGTGPKKEFCEFSWLFGSTAGENLKPPRSDDLSRLATIILENAYSEFS